ncbi:MAG TPA: tRNA (adenosine(37)-N6)-threonylcarbamoyltransferase complex ATPase subunit type 1 TsaE [Thermoanaerobaculia bacterium]|nr:tRNA (adenosine(37)-N6)-threonylcarbamoyltransferase complex ATPase subunit type 1 TsaE [Thermoanaerobaculia bacterium]
MSREIVTRGEEETEAEGRRLAAFLAPEDVVYLEGDLGAGKTCFARGIASGLGAAAREVASPTFAILHEYAGPSSEIVLRHLDLYRLADSARELEVLGLPESVAGAPVIVEWPSRALEAVLPPTRRIRLARDPAGRRIVFDR